MPTTEVPLQRRLASCDSGQGSLGDADCSAEQIALLDQMIEAAQNHTIASQPRQPLVRMVSMEQRWQDLASVLLLPGQQPPAVPPTATLAPPSGPLTQQADFHDSHGALGQTSPPASAPSGGATGGDLLYYQLSPVTPMAEPAPALPLDREEAFLSHLLDADDLDLDSAPITLAAEDWVGSQTGGDVQRPVSLPDHPQSSGSGLNGLGSFSRCPAPVGAGSGSDPPSHGRSPGLPVAQKKHQMYGRRVFTGNDGLYRGPSPASTTSVSPAPVSSAPASPGRYAAEGGLQAAYPPANTPTPGEAATDCEPDEIKFSRSAQFTKSPAERLGPVAHNHSYQQPALAEGPSEAQRPIARDKSGEHKGERLSRDDRRTRAMNIPLSAEDIVHLPMDEFNERLARHQLTEAQLSLVRDVRRRGKNKLAAQNCRKRKLDQIAALTEDLKKVRDQRQRTLSEHQFLTEERSRIRDKYARMHRHVFQSLRDADGRPYSPADFSLQMSADGNVLLVARSAARGAVIVADPAVGAGRSRSQ
ncbi:segmentation protein cap'n'collar-like [Pollicipes pollicipes]|uniref:segmentation protein cap'n'collar-like n=1 Tax=Pollicipes pollicipes TaxID=41117 RepID=UPI001885A227|nr:segmentation protein cap'n'collar-like [Pollicipes pollicipes]